MLKKYSMKKNTFKWYTKSVRATTLKELPQTSKKTRNTSNRKLSKEDEHVKLQKNTNDQETFIDI